MKTKILGIIILILMLNTTALGLPRDFDVYATPGNIQFQVIDPLGNITGYDPITDSTPIHIPNTTYGLMDEPDSGIRTKNNSMYIAMMQGVSNTGHMDSGNYKVKVFGANTIENMNLYFKVFYQNMIGAKIIAEHKSIIYPHATWTYEITIPETPPDTRDVPLIKVANPEDLITDIKVAGQLGYIGNPKFVSELTKEINKIEKNRILYEKDDTAIPPNQITKKEYQELLKKITERYNKPEADEFVKQEAYTVLREDIEYIIGHL